MVKKSKKIILGEGCYSNNYGIWGRITEYNKNDKEIIGISPYGTHPTERWESKYLTFTQTVNEARKIFEEYARDPMHFDLRN